MPIANLAHRHPGYTDSVADWVLMHDSYKGERQIKKKNVIYLPMTSSQIIDGAEKGINTTGYKAYQSYKTRARFPNFVREAVQNAIGMMHSRDAKIELPAPMEKILSSKGEDMQALLRRVNTEQLLTGRVGLMADLPTRVQSGEVPYIALWIAERIINWDDGTSNDLVPQRLNFVVLDESEYVRQDTFDWQQEEKYRVLSLGPVNPNDEEGVYRQGVFNVSESESYSEDQMISPNWMGQTLDRIPFVIINTCDLVADVDDPPLLDLGNICRTIYMADADYRQSLFMQSQDTLVTIGGNFDEDEAIRTGAGARIDVPMSGDAKYIGVESSGLLEQREALSRLEDRAGTMGANTLDSTSRERESGKSLGIRVAARTADLTQIALVGAAGLQQVLRDVAVWIGEDPEGVTITPNLDFAEQELSGQTMVEMATARSLGFPISARTMHQIAVDRKLTKMTYEEEIAAAKEEDSEDHPFAIPEKGNGDMAGAEQNQQGDDTGEETSERKQATTKAGQETRNK